MAAVIFRCDMLVLLGPTVLVMLFNGEVSPCFPHQFIVKASILFKFGDRFDSGLLSLPESA
jgi:hypothetical protein